MYARIVAGDVTLTDSKLRQRPVVIIRERLDCVSVASHIYTVVICVSVILTVVWRIWQSMVSVYTLTMPHLPPLFNRIMSPKRGLRVATRGVINGKSVHSGILCQDSKMVVQ